jgi:hypothetical protein
MKKIDLSNKKFGRLTALFTDGRRGKETCWRCLCECGSKPLVAGVDLRTGHTKSCGCLRVDVTRKTSTTHGRCYSSEYRSWYAMIQRCENDNNFGFPWYGEKGVKVCRRWHKFEHFFLDMGEKPSPSHTLDRIDPLKNYTRENCRWATRAEQRTNQTPSGRFCLKCKSPLRTCNKSGYCRKHTWIWTKK